MSGWGAALGGGLIAMAAGSAEREKAALAAQDKKDARQHDFDLIKERSRADDDREARRQEYEVEKEKRGVTSKIAEEQRIKSLAEADYADNRAAVRGLISAEDNTNLAEYNKQLIASNKENPQLTIDEWQNASDRVAPDELKANVNAARTQAARDKALAELEKRDAALRAEHRQGSIDIKESNRDAENVRHNKETESIQRMEKKTAASAESAGGVEGWQFKEWKKDNPNGNYTKFKEWVSSDGKYNRDKATQEFKDKLLIQNPSMSKEELNSAIKNRNISSVTQAPPAAIAYLSAHPEAAQAFKQKYGYLPGGK